MIWGFPIFRRNTADVPVPGTSACATAGLGVGAQAPSVSSLPLLLRATLTPSIAKRQPRAKVWPLAMLERAQERLPKALSWLEENGRDLLERA